MGSTQRRPERIQGRRWRTAIAAAGFLVAVGCGFFDTRQEIAPVVPPPGLEPRPATSPENILFNYRNAIQFGIVGSNQLEDTLDDAFRMTFDIPDSSELGLGSMDRRTKIDTWGRLATAEPDSFHFIFGDKEPEEFGNTALYDQIDYTFLILTRVAPDSGTVRETYSGFANIRLKTNDFGEWVIEAWDDFNGTAGDPTWGRYIGEAVF